MREPLRTNTISASEKHQRAPPPASNWSERRGDLRSETAPSTRPTSRPLRCTAGLRSRAPALGQAGRRRAGRRRALGPAHPRTGGALRAGALPFDELVRYYELGDIELALADSKSGEVVKPILRLA